MVGTSGTVREENAVAREDPGSMTFLAAVEVELARVESIRVHANHPAYSVDEPLFLYRLPRPSTSCSRTGHVYIHSNCVPNAVKMQVY